MNWDYYPRKPSVASQRATARKKAESLKKKDKSVQPVVIEGRKIAQTFWGQAWCQNLESYRDYANRLPRGRSYVLNEAVVDLRIEPGRVQARLMGSELYNIDINIERLPDDRWEDFKQATSGHIASAIALLKGELPDSVLKRIVDRNAGLFPSPREISMQCDCPDSARMCKHIAASMYGVGHRLDSQPELLFTLRGVDQNELLQQVIGGSVENISAGGKPQVADIHLESVFGVKIVKVTTAVDELLRSSVLKKKAKTRKKTRTTASKGVKKSKRKSSR